MSRTIEHRLVEHLEETTVNGTKHVYINQSSSDAPDWNELHNSVLIDHLYEMNDRLLARIHELEAQAARDKALSEAAVTWLRLAGWIGEYEENVETESIAFTRLCDLAKLPARGE